MKKLLYLKRDKGKMILFIEHMEHILKDTFKNYNTLHSYDEKHVIIKTQIKDLINVPLCNWEYNRPPDILRCNEISEYIQMYKKPFDYIIFITYNSRKSLYEVYDGIHRLTAIMNLYKKLNEENNVEFKKWLLNQYVFLNIRFNASDGEIVDIFKVINKSNPIPDLYIKDNNKLKRDIIENVTSEWTKKYKTHFSANKKPNKPNMNRDHFIEILDLAYDKHNISNYDFEYGSQSLEKVLHDANNFVFNNLPKKISDNSIEKCGKSGLYLFLYSIEEIISII